MIVVREDSREELALEGEPLGQGGEAIIYAVAQQPSLVAKIYHRPTAEHGAKLAAMLASVPDDPMAAKGKVSIAWPRARLLAAKGTRPFVGYLMPRITSARLIYDLYHPLARARAGLRVDYAFLLRAAQNLAGAVRPLHELGYVIGDLNETNILVNPEALVTLVDTDSFQVRTTNRVYRCVVGTSDYTPPELQDVRFADIERSAEHDCFGLAVLIFQLLMQGTHAFAGVYGGPGEQATVAQRIKAGHWPYACGREVPYTPRPQAPPWEILPAPVQDLMRRCFEDGHSQANRRPTAREWQEALHAARQDLATCRANEQHVFAPNLGTCPWCERAARLGRDPFPPLAPAEGQIVRPPARSGAGALTLGAGEAQAAKPVTQAPDGGGHHLTRELLRLGKRAIANNQWHKAKYIYLQALGMAREEVDIHADLGRISLELKEMESAVHHFREVIRLDPGRASALNNLGVVLTALRRYDEAITVLREAVRIDPDRSEGHLNLGRVYGLNDQPDLAIPAYRAAIRLNPRMAYAHLKLAKLYSEKSQFLASIEHYEQALTIHPTWQQAAEGLATVVAKVGARPEG